VRSKKQLMFIVFMVIIILPLSMHYTYSELSPVKRRELVTAYMNGYYRALQLDVKEIKKLQNDKGVLKYKVKAAGGKYADLIDIMNSPKAGENRETREYRNRSVKEGNQRY
jgi:hypothetical protein